MKTEERARKARDSLAWRVMAAFNVSLAGGALVIAFCTLRDTQIIVVVAEAALRCWQFCRKV